MGENSEKQLKTIEYNQNRLNMIENSGKYQSHHS